MSTSQVYHKALDDTIDEMRATAKQLIDFTHPQASKHDEHDIDCLKQRQITVDGYDVAVHFSISQFPSGRRVESLEIVGVYVPFLPMFLVCKIAGKFLGSYELKYAESFKKGRKVYIWTVAVDNRGCPIKLSRSRLQQTTYDGFTFSYKDTELL